MNVLIVRWDHNMHSECSKFIKKYKCRYDWYEIVIYWEQCNRLLLCKNKQIYKGHSFIESYRREYWKVLKPIFIFDCYALYTSNCGNSNKSVTIKKS